MYTKPYNDGLMNGIEHVPEDITEVFEYLTDFPLEGMTLPDGGYVSHPPKKSVFWYLSHVEPFEEQPPLGKEQIRIVSIGGMLFVRFYGTT